MKSNSEAPEVINEEDASPLERKANEASDNDRAWFESHPHRQHRIRMATLAESAVSGVTAEPEFLHMYPDSIVACVVKQIREGVRVRYLLVVSELPPNHETVAANFFAFATQGQAGEIVNSLRDVFEQS